MSIISVGNVSLTLDKQRILNDISLDIRGNEIVGLIGPSGAGKTMLVKTIVGMQGCDTGNVELFGTKMPDRKILNNIGYMAQSDALYESLSAKDNIQFFGQLYDLEKRELNERMGYIAELFQLEEHLKKKVSAYSGGMKRRLSFGVALIHDPDLLILDEPTVGLDPMLRKSIWKELEELRNNGKTILVTTHVMDEAIKCDRLILIRDGAIIANGKPDELLAKYHVDKIEDVFLKSEGEQ